ncbi:MAG: HlyC/CorC family transporter [Phycisphaeraceae bacterium]|nr:MAG: HlyC/CorC family transporter [Phycisphaeraceae bacterium]
MTEHVWLWIALAAVAIGAVLSAVQIALRDVSRVALEDLVKGPRRGSTNGNGGDDRLPHYLEAILDDLPGHTAAVAVPRVLCTLTVGLAVVLWIRDLRGAPSVGAVEAVIGLLAAGVITWLTGVVIPLALAEHAAERVVVAFAWLVRSLAVTFSPLRRFVAFTTEIVRRLAGGQAKGSAEAREAELLSLVEESEREGDFDETEREMIEAVVEFRSTTVEQIMTPRTEIQGFEYTDDLEAVKQAARDATHSRIPVYSENLDTVVGVLYLKDLLRWFISGPPESKPFVLKDILREATYVPETKTVRELLTELLEEKVHIAFATDEYGGLAGLVTIEDIIEEIFGEIRDEYEQEEDDTPQVVIDTESRTAEIDARADVDDANDALEAIDLVLPENEDWDTVGGFVVTTMGKIPEPGETLVHQDLLVTVLESEPTRVVKVRIEPRVLST